MFKELFTNDAQIQIQEEFDQGPLVKLATDWLKNKYPADEYEFVHKPLLKDGMKTFHVSTGGKTFVIQAKKADTEYENPVNTILFKIESDEEEENEDSF